jgi:hypothetical protein
MLKSYNNKKSASTLKKMRKSINQKLSKWKALNDSVDTEG